MGGGPAGSAAATLLARRSHRVALVHPTLPAAAALAESIPPSATKLFAELGVLDAVRAAGFHKNRGNTVWWAGQPVRREAFAEDGSGFHVDRGTLEEVLVRQASSVGALVFDGMTARTATESDAGWIVRCEGNDGAVTEISAPWMLDATGRHGFQARKEGRQPDRSTTTLALVGRWRREGGWPDEAGHTLVESYADGWAWSVPLSDDVRCYTAMVDQRRADLEGSDVGSMLERELGKTEHIGATRVGATPDGEAWACPASLYSTPRLGRPGLLLLGDAGSFIDPLSSFGVKKALSSGWLAGVVAHTALIDPGMSESAASFFDAREREVYRSYRAVSAPFFEAAAEAHGTTYWSERAASAHEASGPADPSGAGDPDHMGGHEVPADDVRRAFETIRQRDRLDAVPGATLRVFERPGIDGYRVVIQDHLASDQFPEGMRYVRNVDLRHIVQIAPQHADVPDGWTAYNGVAAPVTLPDYLTALSTAFAAGFLRHADR